LQSTDYGINIINTVLHPKKVNPKALNRSRSRCFWHPKDNDKEKNQKEKNKKRK